MSAAAANVPYRRALGLRVAETHPLTRSGAILLPQFFSARPAYVASARGESGTIGRPSPNYPQGAPISAGYFEGLRELAVGQAYPMFLSHYYQGVKQ